VAILRRRGVHNPEALLSHVVNRHIRPQPTADTFTAQDRPDRVVEVTGTQLAVFHETCQAVPRAEIRARYGMAVNTLNHHLSQVCHAMGVGSTTEAVALALSNRVAVRSKQRKQTGRAA
jgi:DNA-binding NarL/FixJ family response regulator